jgi:hypothetical protein
MARQDFTGRDGPVAHGRLPVDARGGQVDLAEEEVDHAVQEVGLVGHVVSKRRRRREGRRKRPVGFSDQSRATGTPPETSRSTEQPSSPDSGCWSCSCSRSPASRPSGAWSWREMRPARRATSPTMSSCFAASPAACDRRWARCASRVGAVCHPAARQPALAVLAAWLRVAYAAVFAATWSIASAGSSPRATTPTSPSSPFPERCYSWAGSCGEVSDRKRQRFREVRAGAATHRVCGGDGENDQDDAEPAPPAPGDATLAGQAAPLLG